MKPRFTLVGLCGLSVGAALAWLAPLQNAPPDLTTSPPAAVLPAGLKSVIATPGTPGLHRSWKLLQSGQLTGLPRRLALADLVSRAGAADMAGLLALTTDDPALRETLLRRWAALDPNMMADWLAPRMRASATTGIDQPDDISIAFAAWAERDPAAALTKLRAICGTVPSFAHCVQIQAKLMQKEVAAGIQFAAMMGSTESLSGIFWNSGGTDWVQQDPAKAAELLKSLPPGEFRDRSLPRVINELSKTDLAAAIALQQQFPDLSALPSGMDPESRKEFYDRWAAQDLVGMTEFLNEKAEGATRLEMKVAIAKSLGESNPERGLKWAAENLSGSRRSDAVEEILTKFSKENPGAALRYVATLPEGGALEKAVDTYSATVPAKDYEDFLRQAQTLPEGAARQSILANGYEKWYAMDPTTLLRTLNQQDPASLPQGIWWNLARNTPSLEDGVKHLPDIPPAHAVEFVKKLCEENFNMNDPLNKLTSAVGQFTAPDQRAAAIEVLAGQHWWRHTDDLVKWAANLPSAAERKIVADQILQGKGSLTTDEREKMVAPLRQPSAEITR